MNHFEISKIYNALVAAQRRAYDAWQAAKPGETMQAIDNYLSANAALDRFLAAQK